MKTSCLAAAAVGFLLLAGPGLTQSATARAAKSGTTSTAATDEKTSKPRSAESLECSKEADAKGLHGKARKKFRSECIRNARAGEKAQ
jgi:hypothetical protein